MMKTFTSVHQYLEERAALLKRELSDEEIVAFKKEYRKAYLKAYKKKYRRYHRQLSVSLTPKEYKIFLERVEQSGQKTRVFIKNALLTGGTIQSQAKLYESVLHIIDLLDEGLFESNLKRIKEALVYLNTLKNKLS